MSHSAPAPRRRPLPTPLLLVALLAAAAPLLVLAGRRYAPLARATEARGRLAFLLTAAKSYADEHESDNDPATADWPDSCGTPLLADDCADTPNFTYTLRGRRNGELVLHAVGKPGGARPGLVVELRVTDPRGEGRLRILPSPGGAPAP